MELEGLDQKTRKLVTMYGTQHPKVDVDRLYLQRCEEGRGLIRLEHCVQLETHSLEKYLSSSKEKILKQVSHSRITENNINMEEVKKKYIKDIEESMKENLFMESLEKLQRK